MELFESMLHEIANELNLECKTKFDGLHTKFTLNETNKHVYFIGYNLPLNNTVSCKLASDKGYFTEVMNEHNINCVEHHYMSPYVIQELNEREEIDIFVKPMRGGGGRDIVHITNKEDFDTLTYYLSIHETWCYCETDVYDNEYRVTILDGECVSIYGKTKGHNDQNNLASGATAFLTNKEEHTSLIELAVKVADALGIRFSNVDAFYDAQGNPKVMEVNSSVCFDKVLEQGQEFYEQSKSAYIKAINKCLLEV